MLRPLLPLLLIAATPAAAAPILTLAASGFVSPLQATSDTGVLGERRLFVTEQGGRIAVVDRDSGIASTFARVPDVHAPGGGELGLLGLAFDLDYAANGRYYVNQTTLIGGAIFTEIRRYTDPARGAAGEPMKLIARIAQPYPNHKAGWLDFGADGMLYVALGDGGGGNDPQNNAQNPDVPLGKMLRLDIARDAFPNDPDRNYAIPESNPGGRPWVARGLRNPFRASVDWHTGDLWIGDVGQSDAEEIDRLPEGGFGLNYGWRALEGAGDNPGVLDAPPADATAPVLSLGRDMARSITGGFVYRGREVVELAGRYVFADAVLGRLYSMTPAGTGLVDHSALFAPFGAVNIVSLGEDDRRELYIVDIRGRVFALGTDAPFVDEPPLLGLSAPVATPAPATIAPLALALATLAAGRARYSARS